MSLADARNKKRKQGAALRLVADGRIPLRDALRDGHNALGTCTVHRLLVAAPGLGPETTRKVLERAHVWPLESLGRLSEFQRQAIIDELPRRVK